jgi:hypothetical protein
MPRTTDPHNAAGPDKGPHEPMTISFSVTPGSEAFCAGASLGEPHERRTQQTTSRDTTRIDGILSSMSERILIALTRTANAVQFTYRRFATLLVSLIILLPGFRFSSP